MQVLDWIFNSEEAMESMLEYKITSASNLALDSEIATAVDDYYGVSVIQLAVSEAERFSEDVYFNYPADAVLNILNVECGYYVDEDGKSPSAEEALQSATDNLEQTLEN